MEEWRQIKRRSLLLNYEVSNLGRVRNTKTGRIRKACKNGRGYLFVSLSFQYDRPFQVQIHILVAAAFLDMPEKKRFIVHHRDENKENNCVDNLEVCHQTGHIKEHCSERRASKLAQRVEQQIEFDKIVRSIS